MSRSINLHYSQLLFSKIHQREKFHYLIIQCLYTVSNNFLYKRLRIDVRKWIYLTDRFHTLKKYRTTYFFPARSILDRVDKPLKTVVLKETTSKSIPCFIIAGLRAVIGIATLGSSLRT